MRNYRKKKTVTVDEIGDIEIQVLSWKQMQEILASEKREDGQSLAITCKYGVPEWKDESLDDIADSLSPFAINQLCAQIYKLMGVDSGKVSASALNEDSPSD